MLVSCILPTCNRRRFLPQAIRCFLAQDYAERELIVVDDGSDPIRDLLPGDARIRYFREEQHQPVGRKRNLACRHARGEIIAHWDDDDWSAPWRLSYQVEQLHAARADVSGLDRVFFFCPAKNRAWEYFYPAGRRPWVYGASLCYTRKFWADHPFPEISVGEDNRFVWSAAHAAVHRAPDARFLVALVHDGNTSRKQTADRCFQPREVALIEDLLGADAAFYRDRPRASALDAPSPSSAPLPAAAATAPRALVAAALGIGDILRVTPLIQAVHHLGYAVDVLLCTDYPETAALLRGAPAVREVHCVPSGRSAGAPARMGRAELPAAVRGTDYELALFTTWSAPLQTVVRARRVLAFDRAAWLRDGDARSAERLARDLGWRGEMPAPFAMPSARDFALPPGTVALHPGCKADWPWKKWHGFPGLARLFPRVVIVGSTEDQRVDGTYFLQPYVWPDHARDFSGQLTLADTAALLRQCAAVVANDSGLMHLATALGVPTFGVFGLTSPSREGLATPNFHPLTKGLPCEAACHRGRWGRRDCAHHLACLKTLTSEEVFMKVTALVPSTQAGPTAILEPDPPAAPTSRVAREPVPGSRSPTAQPASDTMPRPFVERAGVSPAAVEPIHLTYYGHLFDASGYGHAARAYLHALHAAGVELAAVDLANHPRQVSDPLVETLASRRIESDFHLFHGIPPQWARRAFPLQNVIAMTVWETDALPPTWRPALNHACEVWLPCDYNVQAFTPALTRPVFKLPHAWWPGTVPPAADWAPHCGIRADDFVFYSIFEWQERKGPGEIMEAFLRAFPYECGVVLVLKTNPGAAAVAAGALADLRRRITSEARIEVRAEAWSESQVAALQARGDAYVSLHHGEGWNYPLFEAAGRGKGVIATGFSGPLEYLDPAAHHLVQHRPAAVRQRYAYYSTSMRWAEPDVPHAVECLRTSLAQRTSHAELRRQAGERIQRTFAFESVGLAARRRLHELLRRTNPPKWQRLEAIVRRQIARPPVPIPATWYDADYFEHGRKSNWHEGYAWSSFAGLFRDTADFLVAAFPEAETFLDVGCAKGFLVRALREKNKAAWGTDHSPWAIENAEELARPFVRCASAEAGELERDCDVTLCFSLLESLTEEQADAFLRRVRGRTRQALFAVIAVRPPGAPAESTATDDRDLSHITLRAREWWDERMLAAGWRKDALHRIVERQLQRHPLPTRMGWAVFVCAPGETQPA